MQMSIDTVKKLFLFFIADDCVYTNEQSFSDSEKKNKLQSSAWIPRDSGVYGSELNWYHGIIHAIAFIGALFVCMFITCRVFFFLLLSIIFFVCIQTCVLVYVFIFIFILSDIESILNNRVNIKDQNWLCYDVQYGGVCVFALLTNVKDLIVLGKNKSEFQRREKKMNSFFLFYNFPLTATIQRLNNERKMIKSCKFDWVAL